MEIREFIATLEKSNFSLSVENGKLHLRGDKNKLTKAEIEAIKTNKDVIDYIKTNKNEIIEYVSVVSDAAFVKTSKEVSSIYRLSGLQQGMLFHGLFDQETEAHKIQFICDLIGVNTELFSQSWSYLLKKHSILRSGFYYDAFSVPVQCVYREIALPVTFLDYHYLTETPQAAALQSYEEADRIKGFDFKAAPLMRLALLRMSRERYRMIWTSHHILFDGWSLSTLMEEFLNTYESLISGNPVKQGEEDRYEDYIRYIERKDRNAEEAYWRNYLRNVQQSTLLPFIETTKERNKGTGTYGSQPLLLDTDTTSRIQNFAQRNRLTVNTVMQATWAYLLYRYTGNSEVTYGVIVSGRPDDLPGVEQRVGLYINTLPLHTAINDEQKITEWLAQLQAEQVASRQYQYTPLSETQQWTGVKSDLFDSLLVFENYPVSNMIREKQWHLQVENVRMHDPANYPLTILINSAAQINIVFYYNVALLDEVYVNSISDHFKNVLLQISEATIDKLSDLRLLSKTEEHRLLTTFNATDSAYPHNRTIIDLFEDQVKRTQYHIAQVFKNDTLTYTELNEKVNQLAHYLLQEYSLKADDTVCVLLNRSAWSTVTMLAIGKTGACYVPIDYELPNSRLQYIIDDCAPKVILSSDDLMEIYSFLLPDGFVAVSSLALDDFSKTNPDIRIDLNSLSYVIYTSGSTGMPKGVMQTHRTLFNLVTWNNEFSGIQAGLKLLQYASFAFDLSLLDVYFSLSNGGSFYILEEEVRLDFPKLAAYVSENGIELLSLPFSALNSFITNINFDWLSINSIRHIISTGEQLLIGSRLEQFLHLHPHIILHNFYGPSETHVVTAVSFTGSQPLPRYAPIGKPISNSTIYILDKYHMPVPVGIAGEVFIGGDNLARGYLKNKMLSEENFVPHFFKEGELLYKAGDLARWLPDGNIEYLGRIDNQLKIRGYRIELGEIESVLQQSGLVSQNVVVAQADKEGNKRLIGYVVSEQTFNPDAIISWLTSRLPDYMVPSIWIDLEVMPLTLNGKIDKRALPTADQTLHTTGQYVTARTELEAKLVDIWQDLLGLERVGILDNFFEIGGHSLLAMRVISFVRRKLNIEVTIKDLFVHATIASLADYLQSQNKETSPAIIKQPRPDQIPLSFSQERLWFINRLEGSTSYHLPAVLHLKGKLDTNALEFALQKVVSRHEVLRTVIKEQEDQTVQYVLDENGWRLSVEDGLLYEHEPEKLQQHIEHLIRKPFDLSKDHMLRADLIVLNQQEQVLVLTMHHISSDGWSISILVKEAVELYEAYIKKRQAQLVDIPIQYADYAIWQRNYLQGNLLQEKLGYWKEKLADVAPLELPTDYVRPAIQNKQGSVAAFHIHKGLTGQLQQLSNQHGATLFMTLLSVFKVLLYRYSGQEDICVGTPVANRTQYEIEGLIGFFINTLALRSKIHAHAKFTELLEQVKATTLEAYQHQDVPFEKVVDAVVKHRDLSRSPLFQVMLVYQNTPEVPTLYLEDVEVSTEHFIHNSAKFDLTFTISETADGVQGFVQYSSDLFNATTVERLIQHFMKLLDSVVKMPAQAIGALPMLTKEEEINALFDFNDTQVSYPEDETIISLFEKQVQRSPEAVALVFGQEQLTYMELNEHSNQLAYHLQSRGVKEEVLVPVCIEKSLEMMIGILGILKAGGAYVPVDPDYPLERIDFILKDTQAGIVIAGETQLDKLSVIFDKEKIVIPGMQRHIIEPYPVADVCTVIEGKQLAYVLYTSGSTGKPKGVQVQHDSFINHLQWFNDQYEIADTDSTLLLSSFSFDGCMTSMWPVLTRGGVLHLPENTLFDPDWVLNYIAQRSITYLKTLPGVFHALIKGDAFAGENICASLRLIIVGGEKVDVNDFNDYINKYPHILFANHYGPTECTISSSFFLIDRTSVRELSDRQIIGKPVSNTRIYITGEGYSLNPVGVTGEICIGGIQVARGYLNLPEITAKKFISDPFYKKAGTKLYKTGDLGRWLPDGNIEYLERKDDQVKIRGYRIELGEIENVLNRSKLVHQAVVLAKEDHEGNKRLVSYVVADETFHKEKVILWVRDKLPEYMVPMVWVKLESMPLTSNGKIDKRALPHPDGLALIMPQYAAPRNEAEEKLVKIWQQLLKVPRIGIHDNFFELGGHSLLVMRVISLIRKNFDNEIAVKDAFLYPTIATLALHVSAQNKGSLLPKIEVQVRAQPIPLSFSQERLWFMDQLHGSVPYHLPAVLKLSGRLQIDGLQYALQEIANRHEVLRTVILENDGKGFQYVLEKNNVQLAYVDGSEYENDREGLQTFIQLLVHAPFDLSKDQMMRPELIKLGDEEHLLVITMHHIASDKWSSSIFVKEVVELYASYVQGRKPVLSLLPIQYADYAIWQRTYIKGDFLLQKINYWKEKLKGVEPLELPVDYPRLPVQGNRGNIALFNIIKQLGEQLKELSLQQESTLFMTLLAAFKILLHRYSGQHDICVGTSIAGRQQHEMESLIGFFVNILALRTYINNDEPFTDLLQQVKQTTLEAYEHQDVPFEKVVDAVVQKRDMSSSPVFQVMLVMLNTPEVPLITLEGLTFSGVDYDFTSSKYDITFFVTETPNGLSGAVEYSTDLFSGQTISRMAGHFNNLLHSIVSDPRQTIADLTLLSKAEEQQLIFEFNNTDTEYPGDTTILDLFEKQVQQRPEAVAVVFEAREISYGELNNKSNRLAHYLREKGVREETLVPVCLERSADLMVSILGVLKAGGAYVPVDPQYPQDRIRFILQDIAATIVITNQKSRLQVENIKDIDIIDLDVDCLILEEQASYNLPNTVKSHHLAYVMYTSGSTGKPKGVLVEHGNVVSLVSGVDYVSLSDQDILLSTGSPAFDATTFEYWSMLLHGGQLILCSDHTLLNIELLKKEIESRKVGIMWFTSSWFNQLAETDLTVFEKLNTILVGGEKLSEKHIKTCRETYPSIHIINGYGPTENTTFSLTYAITETDITNTIPIGKPLSNRKAYVLDKKQNLVPVGVVGEIYVGGSGVTRGYLNRPELTNEKFTSNPFSGEQGSRLYKTGDLGRCLPDGNIEYTGRTDDQVKIRGFRIELGEIESVLQESEAVRQAVVIARIDRDGTKRLVGYLVPNAHFDKQMIRQYLKDKLPDYMVPAVLMEMEELPLTSNGKIDRKALPDPDEDDMATNEFVAPRNHIEQVLAAIWQRLLDVGKIGVHDNFFDMGGDSLLAIRVISVIRKELKAEISIGSLFEHQTISSLATQMETKPEATILPAILPAARPAKIPLSFSQQRLWFIDKLEGSIQYHVHAVLRLKGDLNKPALQYALQSIVNRHEVLRTVIRENDGLGYQLVLPKDLWKWKETDGAIYAAKEALLPAYIEQLITAPFDLSKDQMLRAEIIRLGAHEHILVVTMHHIASDGWSLAIIIKEVMAFYEAFIQNKPAQLPELKIQFADYAIWQKAYLQGEVLQQKIAYWKSKLDGVAVLQLPYDHTLANSGAKGAIAMFDLSAAISEKLQLISRENGATLFMTLLAAFKVLMYRYTGQGDICVGTSVAGRQLQEFDDLIGFFVNAIALRTEVNPEESFTILLKRVSITTLDAFEHQDVPFEKVVDAVLKERDAANTPLFQIVFAMQNTIEMPELQFGEIRLSRENYAQETVKFNLVCNVTETGNGLSGSIQYATDKFSRQTVEQMIGIFKDLLETISGGAEQQIKDLIKTKKEEASQVINRKAADTDYLWDKTMVDLFEHQAALSPDAIAIVYEEQQLTYRELNEWSNKVARYLISAGVKEEDLILICMERSPELYVGILGILKAGGAFLPVDPVNPKERIQYMQHDSKAAFAMISQETAAIFDDVKKIEVIELGKEHAEINKQIASNLHTEIEPNHLAYVIYTSGSTGRPKGVSIMHRSNVNMSTDQVRQFGITVSDKVLQFASISFDASVSEIFMAFYAGATLVIMKKEVMEDTGNFIAAMRMNKVSVVTLPPVYLKALPLDDLHFLRVIITAGEAPDVKQAAHLSRYTDYYNAYGPTECAVCASIYKVTPEDANRVRMPIGKPIANTYMYVLDEDLRELPAGMQGEIYVSGIGLAKGYLHRTELTAEKFISNPFGTGKKLYKTGDIGRWLNDGNLEYLGRKDDQIKLRGYRVELGEIENTLLENDEIENCAVVVNELKDDIRLLAYYQPKNNITLWPSVAEFYVYDDLLYKTMAGDEKRNAKYRNALRKVVKDKIILEIGPGSEAILSRIAIEEGAKKVYAVELLEESYLKAKATVESLGLQDQIIVIHDDITTVELPEKADYCISEIVGAIGGSEGAALLINSSRRLLKDPSHMIPTRSLTKIAAITLPEDHFDYSFEQLGAYYVSKIFEAAGRPFDLRLYLSGLPAQNTISTSDTFENLDYTQACPLEGEHAIRLLFEQDAFTHGFIVWLNLYCDDEEVIDTGSGKYTWLPIYLPVFDAGEKVAAGDYIEAKISRKLSANGLNPDFAVYGTLVRNHLPPKTFSYESFYSPTSFRGNYFYKKVFENEAVKISERVSKDALKAYLNARLPDYMVPSLFMELAEFPVTISGKIDRKALPAPDPTAEMAKQYEAPRNEAEKALVEIWEEILEVENIGIRDDFFELGGHSLMAIRLISLVRQRLNIEVPIGEVFENPTIALLARRLETLVLQTGTPAISIQVRPAHIPLSFAQERLFFIDQLEGSVSYHLPAVLRLRGDVNKAALQIAFQTIVSRHEVLRTVILVPEGQCYQQVMDDGGWDMVFVDGAKFESGNESLQQYIAALLNQPFNLSADHNLRACLISLNSREHLLVVTVHHIASDGWSFTIMVKELVELYTSYDEGRAAQLPALPVQYADYAIWQRAYLRGDLLDKKLDYWKKKLEGITVLQLPSDYPRPPVQSSNGAVKSFRINIELKEALNSLARRQDATLFMTLLAAFKVLLYQYSGQEDICIGTPVANRMKREVEALIGFFVNTLVIRSRVDGEKSFVELLQQVKTATLEAFEYGDVPFEKVVDVVMKERDRSRHPLFQIMFMLQNTPDVPEARLGNVQLTSEPFLKNTSKFDLSFALVETATGLLGAVEYCTDLFSEQTIVRMMRHYELLLNAIVAKPAERTDQLSLLTEAEKQQLIAFNNTDNVYPSNTTIIDLFEAQVEKTPDAIALVFEDETLSYDQLNRQANQLAHYLISKGVQEESLVPICIERGPDMITGLLAILKAGAAYVPIDPDYPPDRIRYMLDDSAATLVITSKESRPKLHSSASFDIIELGKDRSMIQDHSIANPAVSVRLNRLAYVMYTSGSTGRPKGVMIEHSSLTNVVCSITDKVAFSADCSFLSVTTFSFDISYLEFYTPLVNGGKLIVVPREVAMDGYALSAELADHHPTHMQGTPASWQLLLDSGWDNKEQIQILIGGEAVQESLKNELTQLGNVYNLYGPTETTIWSAIKKLAGTEKVLIGQPLANTAVYIVNDSMQLVAAGCKGEICIGGAGLARGYWNRAELTAERFIKDPFSTKNGSRLYKTGDLGRWLADGNIEYLGRMDEQVKIRGYRIEPGEIENVLMQSGLVKGAVVVARQEANDKHLVGYVVSEGTFNREELVLYVKAKLPEYMVPALWVQLESLPLTANGKIDRKALPEVNASELLSNAFVVPESEIEKSLAAIWQELLSIERAGIHDNFFELGGHSLLAMRMISVIRTKLQVEVAIKDIFIHPTIATLAAHLSLQNTGNLLPPVTVQTRPPYIPLSFSQERLFFIHQLEGSIQYHIPLVLRLKGHLDVSLLQRTLQTIVNRHEILRTVLLQHEGDGYQSVLEKDRLKITMLEDPAFLTNKDFLKTSIFQQINQPFDLSRDNMVRGSLIRLGEQEHILVATLHHIAADGWSLSLIVKELIEIYSACVEERSAQINLPALQYADYAIWQRNCISGEVLHEKLAYWKTKLEGTQPLQLATDYTRPVIQSTKGAVIPFQFNKQLTDELDGLSRQQGVTLFMTLLASLSVLLHRYSGQEDICIGTPVANRPGRELEDMIGLFVNTLALRTGVSGDLSFTHLLQQVKSTALEAYEHQEIPFEKVVDLVIRERDRSRHPLFQVMFVLQNTPEIPRLKLGNVELSVEPFAQHTSRFDLTFAIAETELGLKGSLEYCTDVFSEATMTNMIGHFENLLMAIIQNPLQQVDKLAMLSEAEINRLLHDFNATGVAYPKDKMIAGLFEEQAARTPGEVAVVFEEQFLTYRQLDELSSQLAHYLRSRGVKEETLVPICVERSPEMIVGVIGILKAGGVYVPIDPEYPPGRISYILQDTGATLVVSSSKTSGKIVSKHAAIELIELDTLEKEIISRPTDKITLQVKPHHLIFILYTSGSTGVPKGVKMPDSNMVNLLYWQEEQFSYHRRRVLQFASLGFDASFHEIFSTLCFGSTLYLITEERRKDMAELVKVINQYSLTHIHIPYIVLKSLAEQTHTMEYYTLGLQQIITAGEQLKLTADIKELLEKNNIELVNQYGPTEAHVVSSYTIAKKDFEHALPPIGKPVSNVQLYVLNKGGALSGIGIQGELYIAGVQVAAGYLNREDLTAEKFIKNTVDANGSVLYKTGDLARWLPDGNLEYLGRIDDQLKIRGNRVELGEIETVLQQHEQVRQAVVLAKEDSGGNRRLVGYVVPENVFDRVAVVGWLRNKLPEYMVPALWVVMENFPVSPNGKIDRKVLPDPDFNTVSGHEYVAPRNEQEAELVLIWQELLGTEKVGIHDNFFELGGHSLLAMKMVAHLKKKLGITIPIQVLFKFTTVSDLSKYLEWESETSNTAVDDSAFEVINI